MAAIGVGASLIGTSGIAQAQVDPAFEAYVNFGASASPNPDPYVADTGNPYGDRANGFTYGWVDPADGTSPIDIRGVGRYRNTTPLDPEGDSLIHMGSADLVNGSGAQIGVTCSDSPASALCGSVAGQSGSRLVQNANWEIEVPNGDYAITLGAGDPGDGNDPEEHDIEVEGVLIANTDRLANGNGTGVVEYTGTVTVTDGLLTMSQGPDGYNAKPAYIDIVEQVAPVGPDTPADFAAATGAALGTADLSWTASPDAVDYDVLRDGVVVGTVTETSFTDTPPSSGTYLYSVVASNADGDSAPTAEIPVGVTYASCGDISLLDCADVPVPLPYELTFEGTEGGLADGTGVGTGFTMVDAPSARLDVDGPAYDPGVPGYEPANLTVDTAEGQLEILSTKGIAYRNPGASSETNSQINALGVGVDPTDGLVISTTLDSVNFDQTSQTNPQAGIWYGLNEAEFAKLVVVRVSDTQAKVQLAVEKNDGATSEDNPELNGANIDSTLPIDLELTVDPVTDTVSGTYAIGGGTPVAVEEGGASTIDIPEVTTTLDAPAPFAGLYASQRRAGANEPITAAFSSFSVAAIADTTAPAVPQNVVAEAGDGEVTVTWDAVADTDGDLAGYNVYEDEVLVAGPLTETSYLGTSLTNGTEYSYTVTSVDLTGNESDPSAAATATPEPAPDTTSPEVPANVVTVAGDEEVSVSWDAVADADGDLAGYNVYVDGVKSNSAVLTGVSYTATGLTNGTEYDFTVTSLDATGNESVESSPASATPQAAPDTTSPEVPANVVTVAGDEEVSVSWDAVADADGDLAGYNVYVDGVKSNSGVLTGVSYTATGLTNGTEYDFTVTSLDTTGNESVESAAAPATPEAPVAAERAVNDFEGDGTTDLAVFRNGVWYAKLSSGGALNISYGLPTDVPVAGDYDGDGTTDVAVFRNGVWYAKLSSGGVLNVPFGGPQDLPVPGDYDGDGTTDVAVFAGGVWYAKLSSGGVLNRSYGLASDVPVPGDYDGDGTTDIAVFRNGSWYARLSGGGVLNARYGLATDLPVPGDYDDDGTTDIAVFRDGFWYAKLSGGGVLNVRYGLASDLPVLGDYDGDAATDITLFRRGVWYVRQSSGGVSNVRYGLATDRVLGAVYRTSTSGGTLNATPASVVFDIDEGNQDSRDVAITGSAGTPTLTAIESAPWLDVTASAGNTFTFDVDGSGLAPGDYETSVLFTAPTYFSRQVAVTLTVNAVDVNEAPVAEDATFAVDEDAAVDSVVDTVVATDVDSADLVYSITAGNDAGDFAIDVDTGEVSVAQALDFETTAQYTLTVTVSDGDLDDTAEITIDVNDVNESPEFLPSIGTIAEDATIGDLVTTVVASDPDGDDLTFEITAGNSAGDFAIDPDTGAITVAQPLDYETTPLYALGVTVSDDEFDVVVPVSVGILDVNDPPVADDATFSIDEDAALDAVVGTVAATDVDSTDLVYSITAGNEAGDFAIDEDTGEVSLAQELDFETTAQYTLTVNVSDGELDDTAAITIDVNDVDEDGPACTPVSTLPCDQLAVETPFSLDFDGTEGGLADTGFTLVDAPSNRFEPAIDQAPAPATATFPDVVGYEPGLLTVDAGNLTIDATKGIQYATPDPVGGQQTSGTPGINAQLNSLGVAVAGGEGSYELATTVIAPEFDVTSGGSQQAGLTWFVDEDTYIKLVVVRVNNTTNRVQLAVESLDAPTADDADGFIEVNGSDFGDGQDVELRMVIDAATSTVTGFYSVADGAEVQVDDGTDDSLVVPAALLDGVALDAGLDPTVNAGLFATKRAAPATDDVSATFADFSVSSEAPGNSAPAIADIGDLFAVEGEELSAIDVAVTDADGDDITVTVEGLPAGVTFDDVASQIAGTPDVGSAGGYPVTITADDATDVTELTFNITVVEPGDLFAANVNFNEETGEQPAGYELDYGLPYGDRAADLTYGWVEAADGTTPLDLTGGERGNGRDRGTSQSDQRLDSLVHMQADDITSDGDTFTGVDIEGIWEIAVPDGTYEVTVAAGDPNLNNYTNDPEVHALNVEGEEAIAPFAPIGVAGDDGQHQTATVTVVVTDGLLTIDADGGTNTKIDYVDVVQLSGSVNTPPEVLLTGDRTLFNGQDTIIPVDTFDDQGDTVTVDVTGLPSGLTFDGDDISGTIAADADAGSPYTVEVTGDDGTDTTTETFTIDVIQAVDIQVNFQAEDVQIPAGYIRDFGQPFGARTDDFQGSGLNYGWVAEGTSTPLSLEGNGRDRDRTGIDQELDTFIHMQYGDIGTYPGSSSTPNCTANVCDPGAWEIAVPDGLYEVTLAVGDQPSGGLYDSVHAINVESGLAILEFQADAGEEYLEVTAEAGVEDGRLTISAIGGNNTKLSYVEIRSLGTQPFATQMIPANRATDVAIDSGVSASVSVPGTGVGVNPSIADSLTDDAVKLFKLTPTGEVEVDGNRGSTGGNDTINFSPQPALEYDTTYRYVVDGVLDEAGNTFGRFQSTFSTQVEPDDPDPSICADDPSLPECQFTQVEDVDFEQVLLPEASGSTNGKFIASMQVHQGHLWYTTVGQGMYRHEILPDGTLGVQQNLGVLAGRAAIGLVFDKNDPDLAWVTHATANLSNESARTGSKVSTIDFSDIGTPVVQDIFVNLPRSAKDHLSNSMIYGPTGDGGGDWLYFLQGSNQAAGDTDGAWGNRGETQLTAALLRFDPQDVLAEVAANGPIDVATEEVGGTYDPFGADPILEVYATGIRNAFDLIWHSNGKIYVPTNGTAAGGSSPGVTNIDGEWIMQSADPRNAQTGYDQGVNVTDECNTRRADGPYTGGDVTAHTGLPTQLDYVFEVEEGGYYGHPNPTRCEWVVNNGSDSLNGTGNFYDEQDADPNYDEDGAYSLDFNKSPNGVIEYQSETFDGKMQGRVLIVRFSNNDDLLTMQVAPDGTILGTQAGTTIGGFSGGYADPLEVIEDTSVNPGNLYMNQYNRAGEPQQLYLLRVPDGQQAAQIAVDSNQAPAIGDDLIMSATLNGEGPTDTHTVTVRNRGAEDVEVTGSISGTNATEFSLGDVGTVPAGDSVDVDVIFDPTGSIIGTRTATLEFTTPDGSVALDVRALAHQGQEGGEEPTLQQVFDTFQFGLDSGWSGLAGGTNPTPVGDEVDVDLFERASDGPVIVTPVAAFAPFEDLPFGWYAETEGDAVLNEVGVLPNGQQQTLVPDSNPAAPMEFDPGTDAFGFYYDSNTFNRVGYTEDARNTDGVAHRARIYPLAGDSFYVAFEDASNGDYQDYNFILENVEAAGDDPGPTGDPISVNFQLETAPVPNGYVRDFGQAYGPRSDADQGTGLTYGWVDDESLAPLSLVGNGRDRELNSDQRLDTLMHMDLPPDGNGGVLNDGTWELALANGTYEVTVAVGDADNGAAPESHTINVEGVSVIDGFPKSTAPDGSDARHTAATETVEVTDGKLTVDQIGGTNTKINYLVVTPQGTGGGGDTVAQVNFQPAGSTTPAEWAADSGQLFDAGRGYGWVRTEGGAAKTADTRDRAADSDPLEGTTIIVDDAQVAAVVNGEWEYAIADGTYEVTVSVGDPEYVDSTHGVSAEGISVISGFVPSALGDYEVGSEFIEVTDGRLTLASTGANTKIQWVTIESTGGGDVIPPQVSITLDGPGSGDTFTGAVTVSLDISDATLEFVDVFVDGTQDGSINAQNFATPFQVSGTGDHTVEVVATDGAGNETTETVEFTIIEANDGELTLTNPEAAPFDDRLVMSRIQSTNSNPATNQTATIELGNDGTEPLEITDLAIANPLSFELQAAPSLPATVPVGGSVDVTVLFDGVGSGQNQLFESTLTVTHDGSNGPNTPIELAGQWQTQSEGGNEPNVAEIVEAFGFGTTIVGPGQQINNQGRLEAIGDEVLSQTWRRGDTSAPIQVRQLAAYHTCCSNTATFKWHQVGNKGAQTNVLTHNGQWAQSLLPRINGSGSNPAVANFTPGPAEFSLSIDPESSDWTLNNTGPDSCGAGNAGCQLGHHLRVWPSEDRDGNRIADQWIVVMDYSGINYDFNDNVYLVDNMRPASAIVDGPPSAPTGLTAGLDGSAVDLDWDDNVDFDLESYAVERSVEGGTFERLADDVTSSSYRDTTAPPESNVTYQVIAIDTEDEESAPSATASVDTPVFVAPTERVNAGGPEVTTGGNLWSASQFLAGGKTFANNGLAIANTTDDVIYQTEYSTETGTINLDVPVDNGSYEVRLHFAEIYFGVAGGGSGGGVGSRVFDVNVEGGAIELDNYDIIDEVGPATAVVESFTVNITDGNIDVDLTSVTNQAKLSAFEVVPTG